MKPSNFTSFPVDSILQNAESEQVAKNIMVILKRTGNVFRELTWEEYKSERLKDTGFYENEKWFFDHVIEFCKTEDTAKVFCKGWAKEYA